MSTFDRAMTRFLTERASGYADVSWDVRYDGGDLWEVALWLGKDAEFAGTWWVTVDGSECLARVETRLYQDAQRFLVRARSFSDSEEWHDDGALALYEGR